MQVKSYVEVMQSNFKSSTGNAHVTACEGCGPEMVRLATVASATGGVMISQFSQVE